MKGCKIHGHHVSFIQEPHPTEPVAQMEAQMETQVLVCGWGMWFLYVLVCFVISSASNYEGFLLLDVVGCYCCCWCWWW